MFVNAALENIKPCLTWREGLRCVEVMDFAHRSADVRGSIVSLPLYPELEQHFDRSRNYRFCRVC